MTLGLGFMGTSIPPVANQFMDLFGVGFSGLSVFLSVYYWIASFSQVPAGLLIDRLGILRSLLLGTALSFVFSLAPLLMPESMALAVWCRFFLGLFSGGLFLAAIKVIKVLTPPVYINRVQGVQGAAVVCGVMLPYLVLPLFGAYGWAASYILGGMFCLAFAYGAYKLPLRAMRRSRTHPTLKETWESIKFMATSREVWFIGISHGLAFGTLMTVIGNWLPSVLVDTRPGTVIEDWALITSALLFVGLLGRIFSGDLARKMPRAIILSRALIVITLSHWLLAASGSPYAVIAVAFFAALLCGLTFASIFTLATETAQPAYVATAVGFMNMVANIVNVLLILILGLGRDYYGSFGPGLYVTGAFALIFCIVTRKYARRIAEAHP